MNFRTCPMCCKLLEHNNFHATNYCNECELQANGFSRASLDGLKSVQRKADKDEKIMQAVKEAYDNAKLIKDQKEAERIYLLENPPILNDKYADIRNTIPKYSEIDEDD